MVSSSCGASSSSACGATGRPSVSQKPTSTSSQRNRTPHLENRYLLRSNVRRATDRPVALLFQQITETISLGSLRRVPMDLLLFCHHWVQAFEALVAFLPLGDVYLLRQRSCERVISAWFELSSDFTTHEQRTSGHVRMFQATIDMLTDGYLLVVPNESCAHRGGLLCGLDGHGGFERQSGADWVIMHQATRLSLESEELGCLPS